MSRVGNHGGRHDEYSTNAPLDLRLGPACPIPAVLTIALLTLPTAAHAQFVCDPGSGAASLGAGSMTCGGNAGRNSNPAATDQTFIGNDAGSFAFPGGTGGGGNTAVGAVSGTDVTGTNNTAIGIQSGQLVSGNFNAAIGQGSGIGTSGDNNTALGAQAGQFVQGSNNIAIGRQAGGGISADNTISIGNNAQATAANSVALGTNSTATAENTVSVGSTTTQRRIVNMAAGTLSATSTDAVNGSQLFATNTAVAAIAANTAYFQANSTGPAALATGTDAIAVGNNAQATGPNSIAIGTNAVATGSVAIGANARAGNGGAAYGDNSSATGTDATAIGPGASAAAANSVAIGSNSVAKSPNTVSFGSPGRERRLTNVVAGINPTDAVNVSQLNSAIGRVDQRADDNASGVAMAMALSGGFLPDKKRFAVATNYGTFDNSNAFAVSGYLRLTDNVIASGGVGYGVESDMAGGRAGLLFAW